MTGEKLNEIKRVGIRTEERTEVKKTGDRKTGKKQEVERNLRKTLVYVCVSNVSFGYRENE